MANNVSYGVRLPEFKLSCGLVSVSKQRHSWGLPLLKVPLLKWRFLNTSWPFQHQFPSLKIIHSFFFFLGFVFWNKNLLWFPDLPQTHNLPVLGFQMLGLQVCPAILDLVSDTRSERILTITMCKWTYLLYWVERSTPKLTSTWKLRMWIYLVW